MPWVMLAALAVALVFACVFLFVRFRPRRGAFSAAGAAPPTLRVPVFRTFEPHKRAALDAATRLLH
jgi:hypothetical protein